MPLKLNSHFYTFEIKENHIKLFEVYRKGNGFPNEVYYWNIWNLANGLGIKENNRLERRSDLTGVEIKAASLAVSIDDINSRGLFLIDLGDLLYRILHMYGPRKFQIQIFSKLMVIMRQFGTTFKKI